MEGKEPAWRAIGSDTVLRRLSRVLDPQVGVVLARGAAGTLSVQAGALVAGLVVHVLLARILGGESYGVYVYVLAWVSLLALGGKLGLEAATVRSVAEHAASGDHFGLRGFLRTSRLLVLPVSCVISLVTAIVIWAIRHRMGDAMTQTFFLGCLLLPLVAWLHVSGAGLTGLKRVVVAVAPDAVARTLGVGLLVIAAWAAGLHPGAPAAMAATVLSTVAALAVSERMLLRSLPDGARGGGNHAPFAGVLRLALPLLVVSGLHLVIRQTDILVIGLVIGPAEAGAYAAASRLAMLLAFCLAGTNAIAAPLIASFHTRGEMNHIQRVVRLTARLSAVAAVACAVLLTLFGRDLLRLFDPTFVEAYLPLVILCGGQLANAVCGSVGVLLSMTGQERVLARIMTWGALLNLVGNVMLVPALGLEGAAIATALSTLFWNVACVRVSLHRLGVNPTAFARKRADAPRSEAGG